MPSSIHKPDFRFRFAGVTEIGFARLIQRHAFGNEFVPAEHTVADNFADVAILLEAVALRRAW